MVTGPRQAQLFQRIISSVLHEINSALDPLPGPTALPDSFMPQLETILKTAYKWNRTVKIEILKYDFEPFVVEPFSAWDPLQMESFERLRTPVRPHRRVISSVSLGLIGSVSLGGARVSHVQQKARVLVEEWFYNTARGRTTSAGPAQSRPKPLTSVPPPPLPTNNMSSPIVSQQPGASNQMSMRPPPASNRQDPPPKKGGFLCC
jgi:hypothetical protein